MKYSLPFGLKQKPLPHYLEHGVIKFAMREGVMHYLTKQEVERQKIEAMI